MGIREYVFPFSAIVGQEQLKKALILAAINPDICGILIRGEKGTAKSTAVRGLANLLPEIQVFLGCPYNCGPDEPGRLCPQCRERLSLAGEIPVIKRRVPLVELPVSATEDRVVGSLDFEAAIKLGRRRFLPGLMAEANRGIIYIDEVNLLDDHIVDILLDAAAAGFNVVEREGISFRHPSRFILVGTMNPEEGELRPQILDRFGLCVQVEGVRDASIRSEILRRKEDFDSDPIGFKARWAREENSLKEAIEATRLWLPKVSISQDMLRLISELSMDAHVAGHRADIIMERTSRTLAAWHGRAEVTQEDVYESAELVLLHRLREASERSNRDTSPKGGNDSSSRGENKQEQDQEERNKKKAPQQDGETGHRSNSEGHSHSSGAEDQNTKQNRNGDPPSLKANKDAIFPLGEPFAVRPITYHHDRIPRRGSGRRSRTSTKTKSGRYVRSAITGIEGDIAFDATLRAASPHQKHRQRTDVAIAIESRDVREKMREKRIGNLLLFVVDSSGSMGAQRRMEEAKRAVISLLLDAYKKRDKVGLIAFRGKQAEVVLPPTGSVERAHRLLTDLPTGGKTPLSAGLWRAYQLAKVWLFKNPDISPILIIISDGKANVSMTGQNPFEEACLISGKIAREHRVKSLVVDVERKGIMSFGLARRLADILGAEYYFVEELKAEEILQSLKAML